MTLYEDPQREPEPPAEGTVARRATLLTTGLGGASGTLLGLATHGPAGLFFGVLGTAAVLALEYHGTPEEYAAVTRSVRAARRWLARAREEHTMRADQDATSARSPSSPLPRSPYNDATTNATDEETEPLPWLPDPFGAEPEPEPHDDRFGDEPAAPHEQALRFSVSSHFTLSQVLTRFQPTLDRLLLGVLPDGTPIVCAAKDLCHVALAGATGGGKSSILRLLLAQLCKAGASVLLLNPHYTRFDREAEPPEDWTPFEPYLVHDPMACRRYEVIEFYLKQIATELLPQRLEKYAHSEPLGKPYFLAIEELPAIVARIKHAPDYLAQIVREGRKVGIFLITVAQDFLVSTIAPGGGGAVRDCYRTAYYVGGDSTTARILLDKPARQLPEAELGQGTVLLRSQKVPLVKEAQLVLVPYVDNRALYRLLGPSTYVPTPPPPPTTNTPRWWRASDEIPLEYLQPEQAWRAAPLQERRGLSMPRREPQALPAAPVLPAPAPMGPRSLPARLQQVAQVYEPGMPLARLAERLGVSEQKASIWFKEAKMRGLIQRAAKPPQPAVTPEPQRAEREITLHEAYQVWSKGNASVRELAKALQITYYRANQLYQDMVKAGLLQKKPKVTIRQPD
jgi:DNA segregation ATPase FtsK/SpoIIIE-like protein